ARLHDWPHARPAELAQASEHRSPPGARGNLGVDGARLRKRGSAQAVEIRPAVLGKAETRMRKLAALAALVFAGATWAQTYPAKPITIIVPFTPGSATDVAARLVGEKLNAAWGQPVIVDNRAGAGGTIGIAQTARAEPDGYTLAVVSTGHVVNPVLYKGPALRHAKGPLRRGAACVPAERPGGGAEPGSQERQGARCARQGKAGRAELRHRWRRQRRPHQLGKVQPRDRHQGAAYPAQG